VSHQKKKKKGGRLKRKEGGKKKGNGEGRFTINHIKGKTGGKSERGGLFLLLPDAARSGCQNQKKKSKRSHHENIMSQPIKQRTRRAKKRKKTVRETEKVSPGGKNNSRSPPPVTRRAGSGPRKMKEGRLEILRIRRQRTTKRPLGGYIRRNTRAIPVVTALKR